MATRSIPNLLTPLAIVDNVDQTKRVAINVSGISTNTTRTISWPDMDLTPVGTTTVQTLTNKNIDATTNTLVNINNACIASTAAINPTKLGNGDVNATQLSYLNSTTSNIQTQINGKANTIHTHVASDVTNFNSSVDARITLQAGQANGLATLDATGHLPIAQLSVGGLQYKGSWNANTNTPTITSGVGTSGWLYIVATPGNTTIDGVNTWALGDWVLFDGTAWERILNSNAVSSVNGKTGAVVLVATDISSGQFANGQISQSSVTQYTSAINIQQLSGAPVGTVVGTSDTQTLSNKSLIASSTYFIDNNDNTKQLLFSISGNTTGKTLTLATQQTTSQTLNIPNITTTDTILTTALAQTITGVKTFSSAPVISSITNTGTLTLPTSTDTLVGRATTDTLSNKTIIANNSSIADNTDNTKQLLFSIANSVTAKTLTLSIQQSTSQTLNIPNITTTDTILTAALAQTITAVKTFSSAPVISSITNTGTLTLPTSTDTLVGRATTDILSNKTLIANNCSIADSNDNTKKLIFSISSSTTSTTLTVLSQQTTSQTLNIPNISGSDTIMTLTTTQTISGVKTFSSAPVISSITNTGTLTLPTSTDTLVGRVTTDTLSNKTLIANNCSIADNADNTKKIIFSNSSAATATTLTILGQQSTSQTLNIPNITASDTLMTLGLAQTITGAKTFTTAPIISSISNTGTLTLPTSTDTLVGRATTDTLSNKTLIANNCSIADNADNTKKIIFSTASSSTTTILTISTQQTASQTLSIPNVPASDTIMTLATTQTISGVKTFSSAPVISSISNTGTLTLPTSTDTLVGRSTSDTLANKNFNEANCYFIDNADNTKRINFSSASASTGTTLTIASQQTTSQTFYIPNIGASNDTFVTTGSTQTITGAKLLQNVTGLFIGCSTYSTGTASQGTTTVTGTGTTFTSSMVGGVIVYNNGVQAFITGFTSSTLLTTAQSQTVATQAYVIYYGGHQADNSGNFGVNRINFSTGTASLPLQLDANKNITTAAINLSTTQVTSSLSVSNGGTGGTTFSSGYFLQGNGTGAFQTTKVIPTGVVVGDLDIQTLTNKSLSCPSCMFVDATDNTKQLAFSISSNTTGKVLTLAVQQTTSQTLNIPNVTSGDALMTLATTQTITAVKTFSSAPIISSITNTGTLTLPTSTDTLIGRITTDTLANKTLIANNCSIVDNADNTKKFVFSISGNTTGVTLTVSSQQTTSQTLSIPNISGSDTLMTLATTQTISGIKTFSVAPVISSITNTGTLTLPTSTDTLVGRATTDTLSNKSLADNSCSLVSNADNTKKIQFNISGNTTGITLTLASQQSTNQTLSIPNISSSDTIMTLTTTQTISGVKTFSSSPVISAITNGVATLTLPTSTDTLVARSTTDTLSNKTLIANNCSIVDNTDITKKIVFSANSATTGTILTIATQQSTSQTLNIPNISGSDTLMTLGLAQTITGVKTFSSAPVISSITNTGTLTLPTSTDTLVARSTTDTLSNKSIVDASCSIVNSVDNTKKIAFSTASASSNTTLTISSQQGTSQTLLIPAISSSDTVVTLATTQTITGVKTFSSAPAFSSVTNGAATLTLPTSTDILVGRSTTDTLSNKNFNEANCYFIDNSDNTKRINFSSASATTGTTLTIASQQTTSQTFYIPNITGSNDTFVTTGSTQTVTGAKLLQNVTGLFCGSSTYNAGTASQATTVVTGSSTTFTSGMVGGVIVYANGIQAFITGFTSSTSLTVQQSQTVSSQAYTIYYSGTQLDNAGNVGLNRMNFSTGTASLPLQLDANKNLISSAINLSTAQVSSTLAISNGGTGASTFTSGYFLQGNGTNSFLTTKAVPTGVVVGTTDSQTLTNKNLNTSNCFFVDNADNTKQLAFSTSSNTTGITLTIASQQSTSQTLNIPNISGSDTIMTLATTQTVTGSKLFNSVTGMFNAASTYSTGTVSQAATTVTGSGTTFTSSMVGGVIVYANGVQAFVTAFVSTTSLTVKQSQTVSSQAYTIYYGGYQRDNLGNLTIQYLNLASLSASMPVLTDANKNLISGNINLTNQITGTLAVGNGGTGTTTFSANNFLIGNGTSAILANKTVPAGNVLGDSDVQTLTNKTIAAGSNTITGLADTNITSSAGINVTKIGNGDVTNTQLSYLNSTTSNIQTQINNCAQQSVSGFIQTTVTTTDATVTTIATIGTSSNTTYMLNVTIAARRTDSGSESGGFVFNTLFRNNAGVLTKVAEDKLALKDTSAWDSSITVSGTNIIISVVGQVSKTVNWLNNYKVITV